MERFTRLTVSTLRSERFFYVIIGLFLFQALWFAFSAVYPMAFDENFHLGLIKIYATQISPFLTSAPPFSGEFGPLTRDNSYLFHYLMSFPYRILDAFIPQQETIIIVLRLLNIAFFTGGLVLMRLVLLRTTASRALIHLAFLFFILIPITPMLAAHINYDNLLFLLLPIALLLTLHCADTLKKNFRLPAVSFLLLVSLCLLVSIVKYAFLPILLALFLYIVWVWLRLPGAKRRISLEVFPLSLKKLSMFSKIAIIALVFISGGLFIERYGVNAVKYHSLVPGCEKVASFEHCSQYGPWMRDYTYRLEKAEKPAPNPATFAFGWPTGMMYRLFFAINHDYDTKNPLIVPIASAYIIAIGGLVLVPLYARRLIRRDNVILLFLMIIVIYGLSIMLNNLRAYYSVGELVAVNGRYFIPLMPIIFVVVGLAFREFIRRISKRPQATKAILGVSFILLFLQGGGIGTFLIRSQDNWYWPRQTVLSANHFAKKIAESVIIFKF